MTTDGETDRRAYIAWRGTLISCFLNTVGFLLDLLIARRIDGMPYWPNFVSAGVGLVLAALLMVRRQRASERFSSAVFLVNVASVSAALWLTNPYYHPIGFDANKLGAIIVGLLAPALWVGVTSIVAYTGTAVLQGTMLQDQVSEVEPLATLFYGVFSMVLLVQSLRRLKLERRAAHAESERAALVRMARALLAVRDSYGSPLQVIDSTAALAVARHPEMSHELAPIGRALNGLRELSQLLAAQQARLPWPAGDESFDAARLLDDLMRPRTTPHSR